MSLGDEPNAHIDVVAEGATVNQISGGMATGNWVWDGRNGHSIVWNNDDSTHKAVVTYTNLNNSSYVDQYGQKHKIAKIVRTFSDFTSPLENARDGVTVYDNPTNGFNYFVDNQVTVTDQFYDEKGNVITLSNVGNDVPTAYVNVMSLNGYYTKANGDNVYYRENADYSDLEGVKPIANATAIPVKGSSIVSNEDGWMNAGTSNAQGVHFPDAPDVQPIQQWDGNRGREYVGAALIGISGDSFSLRFGHDDINNHTISTSQWRSNVAGNKPRSWALYDTRLTSQWPAGGKTADYHYDSATYPETKKVTETIHYKYEDGSQAQPDKTFTKTLTRTVSVNASGNSTNGAWSTDSFAAVPTPSIKGYTPDKTSVPEQPADKDFTTTVTYTKQAPIPVTDTKTVTETVHYKYNDGTTAKPDVTKEVTLHRTGSKDPVTGKVTWGNWEQKNYPSVESPEVPGYTPDKTSVPEQPATKDTETTVTYTKNDPSTPVDPGKTPDTPVNPGKTPDTTTESGNAQLAVENEGAITKSVNSSSLTSKKSLPQTGNQSSKLSVVGFLMFSVLSLLGLKKRKYN